MVQQMPGHDLQVQGIDTVSRIAAKQSTQLKTLGIETDRNTELLSYILESLLI